jgi:hypothetical protein
VEGWAMTEKSVVLIFHILWALVFFYVEFAAIFSLINRKKFWEKKNYTEAQKRKYLTLWGFAAVVTPWLIHSEIIKFLKTWGFLD